ncbi:transcription factor p65-like isoform X3 [Acanthaster planci]|uniref:Transcription factor p65-like isoform X3 n=1 Tax=Acanthaster planci TaxID=133434 RepID=A0A8B7ZDB7_ACAPL|nr:transcription factor p65-like isoform X3 [Acanthaster planci]
MNQLLLIQTGTCSGREKSRAQLQEDESMQSTGSSGASLSLEHIEPGLLRAAAPSSESSKPSTSTKGGLDMNFLDSILITGSNDFSTEPVLEITEQPKQKDLRFRYECEGRSAGSLLGVKSNSDRKTYPTVKIKNYVGKAKIVVSLVTRQAPHQLHPNGLVGKPCKNGICTIMVENNQRMTVSFPNLGIQCAKKKDIQAAINERQRLGVDPFNESAGRANAQLPNDYEMNIVCLCFQAFLPDPNQPSQFTRALPPQVSQPIYDKKGASLNISRVDRNNGTVAGGEEMFILCDKVQKDDIEVVFFHDDWESHATFGPSDIHRQVAIVCKTPPYEDQNIQQPITVQFKLRRKSDKETSDPLEFIYRPIDIDADGVEAKRRKKAPHFHRFFKEPSSVKLLNTDLEVEQLPRVFARAVRTAASGNPKIAKFSKDSSTFSYSDSSNLSSGTVIQRGTPATATTGAPLTLPQDSVANCGTVLPFQGITVDATQGVTVEISDQVLAYQLQSNSDLTNMASTSDFGQNTPAQAFGQGTSGSEGTIPYLNPEEKLLQQLLEEENLAHLLVEQNINIEDLNPPNLEDLTTLQDFDPATLSLTNDGTDGMEVDQGLNNFTLENNVNDSVSIPYSHSVELPIENDSQVHNFNGNCDQNG